MDVEHLILDEVKGMRSDFSTVKSDLGILRSTVMGNGSVGHEQRLQSMEDWKKEHPHLCPIVVEKKEIYKRRAVEVAVMSTVMGSILGIVQLIITYW